MQKFYNKNLSVKGFTKRIKFFVFLLSATLLSLTAVANVYNVTTTTDFTYTSINNTNGQITVGSGVGQVTLRSAIQAADALGGTHTINVPAGTYTLTRKQIVFGNTAQNITITGAGAASTIVSMSTSAAQRDRIFFINPTGTVNSPIITITGIKFENGYLTNDPFGGAAICTGGGVAESLTVSKCIFQNNIVPKDSLGGGAICTQVRGNLSIDSCTFINNVSRDANGGAVLFFIFNSTLGNGQGNLSVTNSTFTGNSVDRPVNNSNGGAIAYGGPGGAVFFSATITKNVFLNNTADGYGGAISANNSPALNINQIHFNRIVNNTSLTDATTSGLHVAGSSGNVNAENNWWGCNTGPSVAGTCDRAAVIGGLPANLDADPWLQLKTTANPNPICNTPAGLGNVTTVTTSFLSNSAGQAIAVADLTLLIGLPVTWSTGNAPVLGTLSAQQATIQASGTATATFTANTTGGNATVNTQVDNIPITDPTARATIVVNTIPVVTADPSNFTSCVGGTATFTATITGTPAPLIQWRIGTTVLVNGPQASGSTVSGQGTATLTITNVQPGDELTTYNVQASNHCGIDNSANASLIVNSVTGGTVGSDQTICSGGDPAAFTQSVASTGDGVLSYQWQSSITGCGGSFSNISGATSTTYDPPAGLTQTTTYRRVTTSTLNGVPCPANSNCITVTINNVTGGTVAADQTVCSGGDPAAFAQSVASTGSGGLTYQWQSSTTGCGGSFSNIGGATAITYDPPAGLTQTTNYRRVTTSTLTGVLCTANSNCITVTINNVTGGTVAADQTVCSGGDPALFTQSVASTGSGALTYQWQSNTAGCDGAFSNIGGATAATYDPPAGLTVTTFYRRVTTSTLNAIPCTANSNCITVTINNVTGGTVGSDQTICPGGDPAAFTQSVASTGDGVLSYQWQSSTTGCGGAFSNIAGATSATYDAPAGVMVTTNYRRVTTSTLNGVPCIANSNCITVTARNVTGGTVAASQSICSGGDPAAFTQSVASTGDGVLTYQWQSSTTDCSTGFTNIDGATSTTYDPPAGLAVTTYYRRVTTSTFNGIPCTANSNCLTVTIATPSITCPTNTSTAACQTQTAVNNAFAAWLATASGSGGVGGVLTNNNTGAPPACGGATTVTFTYTNSCAPTTSTCSATFTVTAPTAVVLTCPVNTSTAGGQTQAAVNAAFSAWLATASGTGGCNGVLSNNNSGAPPASGGSTTVTFTFTSSCAPLTTTCQATFTVLPPSPLICPVNTTAAACQTQTAINNQFNAWLATASSSGGCNVVITNNNTGAPSACGGSTTVTFTYTSTCEPFTTTCSATFTVTAAPVVSLTCPVNTTTAACLTQAQVNTAFSSWLATASASGGCNGVLTNNNTGAPSACGGSTTVTFTYTSSCAPFTTTCQATFTVPAPSVVSLTCPVNTTTAACLTQAQVNSAFSAWLASASASGGCNGVLTNNNTGAPPACGGSRTVTFTYTSSCAPFTTTCQATFTVPAPPTVSLTCPVNATTSACLTQSQVNTAFSAWLATASASGGCNGVLTNNNTGAPPACGGATTVTFTYTSSCAPLTTTCQATFTVPPPPTVSLTCPVNTTTAACLTQSQVNTAFSAWLATASASGGCNGVLTNNNTGAPPACGGSTTVTFTYTSSCAPLTTTCQATFTVPAPTVSLTCPGNTTTSACLSQAQVNTAFSAWLATASASGGCNGVLTNNNTGAPNACVGGSTTVTFTYTSSCAPFTTTCQATFTVPAPAAPVITCPVNTTTPACQSQAQITTAFAAWLATASVNGCGTLTNNNTGAPNACGGATTVTFTATSACGLTSSCSATFTVPPDVTPPSITNESADPAVLWPPNHKMKDVEINYTATDCGAFTTSLSVTSNEPINGTGDGDTAPDWEIIDNHKVRLRAERAAHGDGRIYTITITATDACGNTSSKSVTVVVAHNITSPVSGTNFKVGTTVGFSGVFWDKPGNRHTGKWLIDGSTAVNATITEPEGNKNGRSTGSYKFNAPGVYKLQMNITDQDGVTSYANTNDDLEAIVVIYDPNGGYTYGGGWYDSPAGALASDPTGTGKASYGFSMNYYKNATNPKGETQFEFKVGDFEFNALNFDYLVIQGAKAQFKGTGKIIGGQSGIAFIMTVIDGELDGTGIDKVRMKIYNKHTRFVYYDNQPGASDAASPVASIGTNSTIVIKGNNNNLLTKTDVEIVPETTPIEGLQVAAYPNPTSSNYTIQVNAINTKERIRLQVFDVSGRIVETRTNVTAGSTFTLGENYRPGSYFIRVLQGNRHKEIKLVKLSD